MSDHYHIVLQADRAAKLGARLVSCAAMHHASSFDCASSRRASSAFGVGRQQAELWQRVLAVFVVRNKKATLKAHQLKVGGPQWLWLRVRVCSVVVARSACVLSGCG